MLVFSIKKFFGSWFAPLPIVIFLLLISLILLWSKSAKRQRLGKISTTLALLLLVSFSAPKLPDSVLKSFESAYPSYQVTNTNIEYVVVLGCGHRTDRDKPITSIISHCSMARLMEGLRVLQFHPHSTLILSGYGGSDPFSNAEVMKKTVEAIGITDVKIIEQPNPKDTAEEAKLLKPYLINNHFILVTSASHMPRAVNFFVQQGLSPIPAPTNHLHRDYTNANWWDYAPSAGQVRKSERAIYEMMGLVWQKISAAD